MVRLGLYKKRPPPGAVLPTLHHLASSRSLPPTHHLSQPSLDIAPKSTLTLNLIISTSFQHELQHPSRHGTRRRRPRYARCGSGSCEASYSSIHSLDLNTLTFSCHITAMWHRQGRQRTAGLQEGLVLRAAVSRGERSERWY